MTVYKPANPNLNIPDKTIDTDFTNKSFEELIKELANSTPKNLDGGELGKTARQLDLIYTTNRATIIQTEITRRLIIELKHSTKSTNRLNSMLIFLTAILPILTAILVVQTLLH
jgi:hypothetical protein